MGGGGVHNRWPGKGLTGTHRQVQWKCAHRQEKNPEVFKGFIGAALSPSQCYGSPLVLTLP